MVNLQVFRVFHSKVIESEQILPDMLFNLYIPTVSSTYMYIKTSVGCKICSLLIANQTFYRLEGYAPSNYVRDQGSNCLQQYE